MIRRGFIAAPLALLFPAYAKAEPKSEYGLGKYKRHFAQFKTYRYEGEDSRFWKYVTFPVESILVVQFENGTEQYISFNCPKELVCKINEMSYNDLLKNLTIGKSWIDNSFNRTFKFDKYEFCLNEVSGTP